MRVRSVRWLVVLGARAHFLASSGKTDKMATNIFLCFWKWILGATVSLVCSPLLWSISSFVFLKLRYRKMTERERGLFADLDKEQRIPR